MDYSKLSDLEINGYVLHRLNQGQPTRQQQLSVAFREVDYCKNPADAWPIIQNQEIGIVKTPNGWCATHDAGCYDGIYFVDDSPLRAAMVVFLMMQEGK